MKDPQKQYRIGMVLDQRFPPDARVEREATALVEAGYEVHILCEMQRDEAGNPLQEADEVYRGIHVHRVNPNEVTFLIPGVQWRTRLPYKGLLKNTARALWNIDTVWHTLIRRFVYRHHIDALHIHDLRLVNTGLAVSEKYDIPVVADLHEHYPALMGMLKGKASPATAQSVQQKWDVIEKYCTFEADRVITVVEEARDRLVRKGIRPHKITVLPNVVDTVKFLNVEPDEAVVRQYKHKFLLTYVGHINNEHRGIHTVLEAMGRLKDEIPELHLVLAGGYRDTYVNRLKGLMARYGIEDRVDFTGWLDETDFVSYIEAANVCLCPHLATDHTNATFPNKVFLYHLFSKPVIASSCAPLVRYIRETEGGLIFESGNAADLAEKIRQLYDDRTLRSGCGRKGRKAVLAEYSWKHMAPRIVELYQGLLGAQKTFKQPVGI